MLWGKPKTETEESCNPAKVNDRALIDIRGHRYPTLVEDVRDGEIDVAAPMDMSRVIPVTPNEQIMLNMLVDDGLRRFSGRVIDIKKNDIPLVTIGKFKDLGVLQRRRYDRVEDRISVRYRPEPLNRLMEGLWEDAHIVDISAGGVRMHIQSKTVVKVGERLDIEFQLLNMKRSISASCKVVRVASSYASPDVRDIGLAFIKITNLDREVIHRYVKTRREYIEAERRKLARIKLNNTLALSCSKKDWTNTEEIAGQVFELSIGGLRFSSENIGDIKPDDEINLTIKLFDRQTVSAIGEVMHVEELQNEATKLYTTTARFKEMHSNDLSAVSIFLGRLLDSGQVSIAS